MWLSRKEFRKKKSMVRTRSKQTEKQVEKKSQEQKSNKFKADWIREQSKKIAAYSTGSEIKKF